MQTRIDEITEAIASKDRNNLYVASSFFRDPVKFRAFCAYYAVMRVIDDRVDNLPSPDSRTATLQKHELDILTAWERVVESGCNGTYPDASLLKSCDFADAEAVYESFMESYRALPVPMDLWKSFFAAMRSDLLDGEFASWADFAVYAEGATVAPTTIYLWLIMARRNATKDLYDIPQDLDVFACGRHLGIFAYLAHIVRDLALDVTSSTARLCIAREDMLAHGVSLETLRNEALNGRASHATRRLVAELLRRARRHLAHGRALALPAYRSIESDSHFILDLIIAMYEQLVEKIESTGCDPMADRHRLTELEKAEVVRRVAARTGFRTD